MWLSYIPNLARRKSEAGVANQGRRDEPAKIQAAMCAQTRRSALRMAGR